MWVRDIPDSSDGTPWLFNRGYKREIEPNNFLAYWHEEPDTPEDKAVFFSLLEATFFPVEFRGCDDPPKLKSTKFAKGYCACIWFEELDQHGSNEDVRSVLNSLRRGGSRFWVFYSFNPPKTAMSWVNKETLARKQREDTLVWKTSYLDVVASHPEWLGGPFIEEAEYLREANETAWRWEFLGDVVGTGGNVFSNIVEREVSDEEIRTFERVRNGLDWGWWPDPWRFVRCEWRPGSRRLITPHEQELWAGAC